MMEDALANFGDACGELSTEMRCEWEPEAEHVAIMVSHISKLLQAAVTSVPDNEPHLGRGPEWLRHALQETDGALAALRHRRIALWEAPRPFKAPPAQQPQPSVGRPGRQLQRRDSR